MIMDERLEFADAGSVAQAAGTYLLGDVIPLGGLGTRPAAGEPLYLVITTDTEVITGGTAGTIEFRLVSDAQGAIATDGSATVHYSTGTLVTGNAASNDNRLNTGGIITCTTIPAGGAVYENFLGLLVVVGTTTITAGKVNAFLTLDPTGWVALAEGAN